MAGVQKEFELLFKLSAALGPNFDSSFKSAINTQRALQDSVQKVNSIQQKIDGYTKSSKVIEEQRGKLENLQNEHEKISNSINQHRSNADRLRAKIEETGDASGELTAQLIREQNEVKKNTERLARNETQIQQTTARIEQQTERLNELGQELQEAGVNTENLEERNAELEQSYNNLRRSQERLGELNERQQEVNQSISDTKEKLLGTIGAVSGVAAGFIALDAATEEYRNNQAKLNTAYQAAGMNAKIAKEAYAGFYRILGDDDTATEASQLLAKLAKNGQDVSKWTDIAAGVLGTFGDSLPIEGLIESANETARVGQITGVFADAINWASKEGETFGIKLKANTKANEEWNKAVKSCQSAEDYFNLALQSCGTEAERNKLIMDTLQDTYSGATDAFYKNNKQIIQSRQAQVIYNDILADFGRIAATVKGMMLETMGVTADGSLKANSALSRVQETISKIANNPELIKTLTKTAASLAALKIGGIGTKLAFLEGKKGVLMLQKAFEKLNILKESSKLGTLAVNAGGLLKTLGPIVAIAAAIGAAVYYVSQNLEDVRKKIKQTFGEEGLAIFDKIWSIITQIGEALKTAFSSAGSDIFSTLKEVIPPVLNELQKAATTILPVLIQMVQQLAPVLAELVSTLLPAIAQILGTIIAVTAKYISATLPTLIELINQLIPVITEIITTILPVLVQLINALVPIFTQIIQMILPVIIQLLNALIPIIMQIITAALPVLTTLINELLPIIQMIASTILPTIVQVINMLIPLFQNIISSILPALLTVINALVPVIQFLADVLGNVLGSALQNITSIVQNVMTVFQGLITFITGVFTGNWSQAWNGIKSIFSGAVGGLGNIIKSPLNAVVSAVNSVINGLNKVKVPDWVPGMGGKGINMPTIPGFAEGTEETPETFIAGEEGPELITNAPKRAVYTASETENIFAAQKAAAAAGKTPEVKTAPEVKASGGGGSSKSVVINQTNNITINGDKPEQLEETLQQNNEKLLQQVDEKLNGDEDERRTRYE